MDRVKERVEVAQRALATLQELTQKENLSLVERDAAIQRFEYTFETVWKAVRAYLFVMEGIQANSPKSVIRASFQSQLFDENETQLALKMSDARNKSVHTYHEELANEIAKDLPVYANLLEKWLFAIRYWD